LKYRDKTLLRSVLQYTFHGRHIFKHGALHNNVLSWPLKLVTIGCAETSVSNYYYMLLDSSEERSSRLHRGGSLM